MRILGAMSRLRLAPYDDAVETTMSAMVAVGRHVVEAVVTRREGDAYPDVMWRLVIRSFTPSTSAVEVGRVAVITRYLNYLNPPDPVPDDQLPWSTLGYQSVNLVPLDDERVLVIWNHGESAYEDSGTTSVYGPVSAAFVITVAADGNLTRGPIFGIYAPVIAGETYYPYIYAYWPRSTLISDGVVAHFTTGDAPSGFPADGNAICGVNLNISGTNVTVGAPALWIPPVPRPAPDYAVYEVFALNGQAYLIAGGWPFEGGTGGGVFLYGPAPGGPAWTLSTDRAESYYPFRVNHLRSGELYILAARGTVQESAVVDKFDGTTLTRVRDRIVNSPDDAAQLLWNGGGAWDEQDMLNSKGDMLIWTRAWEGIVKVGQVSPSGDGAQMVDLLPLIPPSAVGDIFDTTMAVIGRNAVVRVGYDDAGAPGGSAATYVLVELVPAPRMGPRVQGARFSRGS